MTNLFKFKIGKHNCIVMFYFDAMAFAAGCIMNTFEYRNKNFPNSDCRLAVLEDQVAIADNAYPIADIGLDKYMIGEAVKIKYELTPITRYPELLYDAVFNLTLGLISHNFHVSVDPYVTRDYISDLKEIAATDERKDVRRAIIDAFNYTSEHTEWVYNIASWYYEPDETDEDEKNE